MIVFAGVVPVIEEIIKPLALWSLAGRKISPQEGFVGGLLCGAGFALIENVLYFSATITAMDWLFVALGRAGTGVLHMLASGLVGWGLAKAWRDGKWVFLIGTSISAIVLHGLWNAVSLATGVATLVSLDSEAATWQDLLYSAPTFILLLISVVGLAWINRYFSKQNHIDKSDNGDIEALETGEVN
jgi:RsiW-degrading membrane proteinase PrsW (M82 family)